MDVVLVRPAKAEDLGALPEVEVAAGSLFRELDMDAVADEPAPEVECFLRAHQRGDVLVAETADRVVGFVRLNELDGALHVEQLGVVPTHGGQGIGRTLMLAAEDVARSRGYRRMILTTFRDVPFNGPFYRSMGWRTVSQARLTPGLADVRRTEAATGLDQWPRIAMEKSVTDD
ncbi:GNAT family N-acetyltransferase [Rhodococcus spongiicola]|uniref:GNAT family N-acetyltransferase n=1 Tax=Rhodococcus spongiicola TaxID=2487352 RepID=A0A3S3BHZ6_9NOCA|nr:GNAT family N-acetyltransferase [Rhodococcus spongiicola]RVW01705.1 GNAT family N-acetyltransferase [Rhodococcus spongiicola]